jgi:phage tail sheath protein FI
MPNYKYPGVDVEKIPGGSKQIVRAATSVTAFVGKAVKGPVGRAVLVHSFDAYKRIYGDIDSERDIMGLSVQVFFHNGGKSAYICRLAGADSEIPSVRDYIDFYSNILRKIRDVSIILLPGKYLAKDGSDNPIIRATLAHCEKMRDRMAIIDPPPDFELDQVTTVKDSALPSSSYAVFYAPWVEIPDPFYLAQTNSNTDKTLALPPSPFAAGIWSRIDETRGVWKAPAGIEARLIGASGLKYNIGYGEQDQCRFLGVNCIRNFTGIGSMLWGARTLSKKPEWRYVPVRRTAIMIEQSIYEATQWVVFEPNDHNLWSALRSDINRFMNGLFRDGAFQGTKASDAYFVRCRLGDSMTHDDIDAGQVIVIVGFAPLKPAEFVIVRIQLKANAGTSDGIPPRRS